MAKDKQVLLSKQEAKFIRMATNSEQGIYDFDLSKTEFKKSYGIQKKEVFNMLSILQAKIDKILN